VSLLLSPEALAERRRAAAGPLAPLVQSLRRDLDAVLTRGVEIPRAKALLSRDGGRCPQHGTALEFDPYRPHEHRCPVDGELFRGERHDRAWVMFYQLWLAERIVHAAALHALTGDRALAELAACVLTGYADQYLAYPNRDNVLGPSRPFFSTYLESIWLLQLAVALDLLEMHGAAGSLGGTLRERVIAPSVELIASYDEGSSNRQVWNNVAILAAARLLDRPALAEHAIAGRSGLITHLTSALLADGTWYEGENYHFFAHRGLWYGVVMAEQMGAEIPRALGARFDEGFAAPLATALPDFTFPARRDSQYGISLRQWRFAESCELGLARRDDPRLVGALQKLYESTAAPRRDTGRWRSTAEAERNEPPSALSRADLGWRSLLLARAALPSLEPVPRPSALLEAQGIAVLRREEGSVYVALDYGESGGGHGHPDRLDLLLAVGATRWLDDMGTGSYVDPTLHWYRSTLAHNAPLIDGRSQPRVNGVLRAFEERGDIGWVDAEVPRGGLAPGVRVRRSLVVMPGYAIDRLEWDADRSVRLELPIHVAAALAGRSRFEPRPLDGGDGLEDGFSFVHDTGVIPMAAGAVVAMERGGGTGRENEGENHAMIAWTVASDRAEWWRATAPGAPAGGGREGEGERPFYVVRVTGTGGWIATIWNWAGVVVGVSAAGASTADALAAESRIIVQLADGSRHEHSPMDARWQIVFLSEHARSSTLLDGRRAPPPTPARIEPPPRAEPLRVPRAPDAPLTFELGESAYRMSEDRWTEAGAPRAVVELRVEGSDLVIDVDVQKSPLVFRHRNAPDPMLDNEHPDIHSDGVQLYLAPATWPRAAAWLLVPEEENDRGDGGDKGDRGPVRVRVVDGARADVPLSVRWHRTRQGYHLRAAVPITALPGADECIGVQVVINDMAPAPPAPGGRERRRGQLVLDGGAGEYVYLRGDRESPGHFRQFLLPRD
jgi:hypothetical protein